MRVELSNGNWAELRETPITVADIRFSREKAHERGFDDVTLDMVDLFPRLITEWSFGAVDDATIDALCIDDLTVIRDTINNSRKKTSKNGSTPSSAGTSQAKARSRVRG